MKFMTSIGSPPSLEGSPSGSSIGLGASLMPVHLKIVLNAEMGLKAYNSAFGRLTRSCTV